MFHVAAHTTLSVRVTVTMPDVSKIDVARYLPATFARAYDQRVFLSARQLILFERNRSTVLPDQLLPGGGIDQGHGDEAPMLPAELLECSISDKCIHQLQPAG